MKNLIAIAGSCLLAGGAIGYIAGNRSADSGGTDPSADSSESSFAISSRSRRSSSGGAGSQSKDSRSNRPKSLEDVVNTPGQTARLQALVELYSGLSRDEFAGEADKLNDLPFNERILNAYVLFAAWAEVAPYEAFEHANSKMGRTGVFVRPTILQSWASSDPKAAANYFEANRSDFAMMGMMGGPGGGNSGAGTIAAEWAKQDPEGALVWAKTLEGRERADASVKAIAQIAMNDPERAASLTTGLEGSSLTQANSSIAAEWAKSDWGKTEGFINGLPADQQGSALGAAVESLASENPSLAATKALEIPEGDARNGAIEAVAKSMARDEPAAAAEWVLKNGSEDAQRESMGDIMGTWVGQDPAAAKDWALARPEGALRDSAVSQYVINDRKGSPEENIRLAESIADDGSRGWAVGVTTMRWMTEDRDSAMNYLQNSEVIDERMRERILRRSGESGQ